MPVAATWRSWTSPMPSGLWPTDSATEIASSSKMSKPSKPGKAGEAANAAKAAQAALKP